MPQINSIPEVLYEPNQPYHYYYDNLPLRNILTRLGLVNIQVDTNADALRGAAGSAGSLKDRLGRSLAADGSLKTDSVDASAHGIGHHSDGQGPDGVEYVRMTASERAKLNLVDQGANRLLIAVEDNFPTIGSTVTISNGSVNFKGSNSIFFDFEAPNIIRAHSVLPSDAAHRHHYGLVPVLQQGSSSSSGATYLTTSYSTPYSEGTLRVYVNGVRLCSASLPVPNSTGVSFQPTFITSESPSKGTFTLNRSLASSDRIAVDFDERFILSGSSSSSS